MNIAISGSTGLIGNALSQSLVAQGHRVLRLVRTAPTSADEISWSPTKELSPSTFNGVDTVIHLAGKGIADGRWSSETKREIRESRTLGTRTVVAALRSANPRPRQLLCASAIGYYGDTGQQSIDESAGSGTGFLASVCEAWEEEAIQAEALGVSTCRLRFGVVLSQDGGALKKMLLPFQLGLAGKLGTGEQIMSWISLRDLIAAIQFLIQGRASQGAYNITAPNPVSNREFTATLAAVLHRPAIIPVPAFALRLLFGELADEALLGSCKAVPNRLISCGFKFQDVELHSALSALLS